MKFICELCSKNFTRAYTLNVHMKTTCPIFREQQQQSVILIKENEQRILFLEEKMDELSSDNSSKNLIISKLESEINALRSINRVYEEEINNLKEKIEVERTQASLEAKLELTKERADRLEHHILAENSKPRNVFNLNLAPYHTPEEFDKICESYTAEHFNQGPEATYKFLLNNCFKDDEGKPRIKCTDSSRRIFKGIKNGVPFVDVGGTKIAKDVSRPIKGAVRKVANQIHDDVDVCEWTKKTSSHYRALEQARLSKRLAKDLL